MDLKKLEKSINHLFVLLGREALVGISQLSRVMAKSRDEPLSQVWGSQTADLASRGTYVGSM